MRTARSNYLTGLCALAAFSQALAAPGDLDFTFGNAGRVIVDFENDDDLPAGLILQPDGRIIVGRRNTNDTDDFSVLRFLPDGARDTSFDFDGRTSLDIPNVRGTTISVLLQPDGKIVAVGWARTNRGASTRPALARYLANGSVDVSFGNGGWAQADAQFDGSNLSAVLQPDGGLVIAGHMITSNTDRSTVALGRFFPDGTLDRSFGQFGYAFSSGTTSEWASKLIRQADGKLLAFADVSAAVNQVWYDWHPVIMRFHPDGSRDVTFGVDSRVTLPDQSSFLSALIQGDGKILLAAASDPNPWDIAYCGGVLARMHSDGRFDDSFGINGVSDANLDGCQTFGGAMLLEPDGKIVLNGATSTVEGTAATIDTYDHVVTRLNSSGVRDPSFGRSGQAVIDVGDGPYPPYTGSGGNLARQDDGKLLVLTSGIRALTSFGDNNRLVLARLQASGGSPGLIGVKAVHAQGTPGNARMAIRVRRSGGSEGVVSVGYSITRGSSGTLTWADGDREDKTITIDVDSGTLSLANVTGGAGLASSEMPFAIPPAQSPPTPDVSANQSRAASGGGAMSWELLLLLLLGVLNSLARERSSDRSGEREGVEREEPGRRGVPCPCC